MDHEKGTNSDNLNLGQMTSLNAMLFREDLMILALYIDTYPDQKLSWQ
jgi:hypothetical protein